MPHITRNFVEGLPIISELIRPLIDHIQPVTPPDQLTGLTLTTVLAQSIRAEWTPSADPTVFNYVIEYKKATDVTWMSMSVGTSFTFDIFGLESGILYDVRVYAQNPAGDGPPSVVEQATPFGVPGAVENLNIVAGIEQAALTWDAPLNSLPAVSGYVIDVKPASGSTWFPFTGFGFNTSATIYALSAELFDFRVAATNSEGQGPFVFGQATPIAIAATLVGLFNEQGVDTNNPVGFNLNQGTIGGEWNCNQVAGNPAFISAQVRKNKPCWQISGGDAGLLCASAVTSLPQPYTVITNAALFFGQINPTRILIRADGADQSYATDRFNMWSGIDLSIPQAPNLSTEQIFISTHNGASSSGRVIINDGGPTDFSTSGNAGTNSWLMEGLGWSNDLQAGRSAQAQFYEHRIYDNTLSVAEQEAVIGAMQQKWWNGFPGIDVGMPSGDFDPIDFDANDFLT